MEPLGHDQVTDEAVTPTCTETGLTEGTHCPRCSVILTAQQIVPALGHDQVMDVAVAPTCTETGLTEGIHCSRCGEILTAQQIVSALGHEPVTDEAIAPTCMETGLTEGSHCSVCGEVLSAQETVLALGHVWIDPSYQWAEDNSVVTASCVCARDSGHTYTETVRTTSAVAKAPTCEAMGDTTYTSAVFGNEVFAVQTKTVTDIPATGHDWNAPTYIWADGMGSVTATRFCKNDHTHIETETVAATSVVWRSPTCESMGKTRYTSAAFNNAAFAVQVKTLTNIDALGHDWEKEVYTWAADMSTVTVTRTCRNDTEHDHVETETVTVTAVVTIPATCETKGSTKYTSTMFENEEFVAQVRTLKDIPALGHDWSAPEYTWAEDNSTVTASRVCGNDPSHTETETVGVTAEVTLPAACEEMGQTTYTGMAFLNDAFAAQSKTLMDIAALGHTVVIDEAVEATCTATGLTEGSHCSVCGKVITAQQTLPMTDHSWAIFDAVPAMCEEPGLTSHVECTVCGRILIAGSEIPATGHEWGEPIYEWAEDRRTVTAIRVCAHDASHVESETVPAFRRATVSPTQTKAGAFKWVSAEFLNTAFTAQETEGGTIPALNELTILTLPAALNRIEEEAFCGIPAEAIIIPDGCAEIASGAFVDCKNLKYVRIPARVTVPADAFIGCPNVVIDQR